MANPKKQKNNTISKGSGKLLIDLGGSTQTGQLKRSRTAKPKKQKNISISKRSGRSLIEDGPTQTRQLRRHRTANAKKQKNITVSKPSGKLLIELGSPTQTRELAGGQTANPTRQRDISISQTSPGNFVIDSVDDIDMRNQGQGVIQWDIVTPGWNFAPINNTTPQQSGIFFKNNADQMRNTPGQIPGQLNRWQANDLNNAVAETLVTYGINAVGPNGATASKDPTIINGH